MTIISKNKYRAPVSHRARWGRKHKMTKLYKHITSNEVCCHFKTYGYKMKQIESLWQQVCHYGPLTAKRVSVLGLLHSSKGSETHPLPGRPVTSNCSSDPTAALQQFSDRWRFFLALNRLPSCIASDTCVYV